MSDDITSEELEAAQKATCFFFLGGGDSFVGGICFMKMHFLLRTDHSENSCSFPESDLSSLAILLGAIR